MQVCMLGREQYIIPYLIELSAIPREVSQYSEKICPSLVIFPGHCVISRRFVAALISDHCRVVHRPSDTCFPFRISRSAAAGRYMVATRDIAALDTILAERAAACGPKLRHPAVCVECLAEVEPGIIMPETRNLRLSESVHVKNGKILTNHPRSQHPVSTVPAAAVQPRVPRRQGSPHRRGVRRVRPRQGPRGQRGH